MIEIFANAVGMLAFALLIACIPQLKLIDKFELLGWREYTRFKTSLVLAWAGAFTGGAIFGAVFVYAIEHFPLQ